MRRGCEAAVSGSQPQYPASALMAGAAPPKTPAPALLSAALLPAGPLRRRATCLPVRPAAALSPCASRLRSPCAAR